MLSPSWLLGGGGVVYQGNEAASVQTKESACQQGMMVMARALAEAAKAKEAR